MIIHRTSNVQWIKSVLSKDNMYSQLVYDGSSSLEDFIPTGVWFILMNDDETVTGMINLKQLNNVLWSPHIFIFEEHRGNGSEEWGRQVADYMKKNYGAEQFLVLTPYIAAKRYAERMGFKQIAVLPKSIKKDGKLLDQYLLGDI